MKYQKFGCLLIIIIINLGCSKDEITVDKHNFEVYLLRNKELKIGAILTKALADQDSTALSKIEIQDRAWLTDDDIDFYDFSSHLIYLKKDKSNFLPDEVNLGFPSSWWDRPFVVVANGQKRYVGIFAAGLSDYKWPVPEINDMNNYHFYPNDLLYIQWVWFPSEDLNDSRQDPSVKEALRNANKLHDGIKVTLNKILIIDNSDTATVKYTYTIKNNDIDNLYVLDPDKMGVNLFNLYCNGPSILRSGETSTRESIYKSYDASQPKWSRDWFVRINSKDSITRIVTLKGYEHFPPGIYYSELYFMGVKKIPKDQRELSDGRYWMGQTVSNLIGVQY